MSSAVELCRGVWRYRGFITSAIRGEFASRYARSRIGLAWLVLQPLAMVVVFSLVLGEVLAARIPGVESPFGFAGYLLTGLLAWTLFAETTQRLGTVFIDHASALKKVAVPRAALPLVVLGSVAVGHLVLMLILLVALPLLDFPPGLHWLWIPFYSLIIAGLALGFGVLVGTLNVFMRDVGQVLGVVLMFGFWLTPIVYPVEVLPDALESWILLNPMAIMVMAYHDALLFGRGPGLGVAVVALLAVLLNLLAWRVFRRASPDLVDVL